MQSFIFPARSLLTQVKKISVDIILEGTYPPLIDEIIKQFVTSALSGAGNGIEKVSRSNASIDARLQCLFRTEPVNSNFGVIGQHFLVTFCLLRNFPAISETELVMIWSQVRNGVLDTDKSSIYEAYIAITQILSSQLTTDLLGQ